MSKLFYPAFHTPAQWQANPDPPLTESPLMRLRFRLLAHLSVGRDLGDIDNPKLFLGVFRELTAKADAIMWLYYRRMEACQGKLAVIMDIAIHLELNVELVLQDAKLRNLWDGNWKA